MIRFTLYSRSYCHLCDDMLNGLHRLGNEFQFIVNVVDVDADERLAAKYDELVPVLIGHHVATEFEQDEFELCHYFLDEPKIRAFLVSTQ